MGKKRKKSKTKAKRNSNAQGVVPPFRISLKELTHAAQQEAEQRSDTIYHASNNQNKIEEGYSWKVVIKIVLNYIVLWFEMAKVCSRSGHTFFSLWFRAMTTGRKRIKKRTEPNLIDLPTNVLVSKIFPYLESRKEWMNLLSINKDIRRDLKDYEDTFSLWPEDCELSTGPYSHLRDPQWSPSGRQVACHDTIHIRIFDQRQGLVKGWKAHGGWSICSLKYFPNGKALVSSGVDGRIKIWKCGVNYKCIHDWKHILQNKEDNGSNSSLAVSPNCKFIAVLQSDFICLVDVSNGSVYRSITLDMGRICNVLFSVNGLSIIFGGDENDYQNGTIKVWNIDIEKEDAIISLECGNSVEELALSPDGSLLASASNNGEVRVWDFSSDSSLQYIKSFEDHLGFLSSVSFTPCGMYVVAGSGEDYEGDLRFWRIADGTCSYAIETNGTVSAIKYSPNGSRCLVQDKNWIYVKSLDPTGTKSIDEGNKESTLRNGPLMVDFSFPS